MASNIKIQETQFDIQGAILRACADVVEDAIVKALPSIETRGKLAVREYWYNSPTYNSLMSGDLKGKLGIPDGLEALVVEPIIDKAAESIKVLYDGTTVTKSRFLSKIKVYILKNDLREILKLATSRINTEKGQTLDWFKWLTMYGDKVIINDFRFFPKAGAGRSDMGIMIKGGYFRIPSIHSGIIGNNFLTRAIEPFAYAIGLKYKNIIDEEIVRFL